jgi:hypothetical protein
VLRTERPKMDARATEEEVMDARKIATVIAIAAMMGVGGVSTALAKAHDQGKADGTLVFPDAQNAKQQIDFLTNLGALDGHGVSIIQNKGKRGELNNDGAKKGGINCVNPSSSLPCPAAQ